MNHFGLAHLITIKLMESINYVLTGREKCDNPSAIDEKISTPVSCFVSVVVLKCNSDKW
jgi:hypothetical protein